MTHTEYDCLNSIRYGMKMYLRWHYLNLEEDDGLFDWVFDAMSYIEDILWDELSRNTVKLTASHTG